MAWDRLVQQTGKYRSIHHTEYPKFQTGIFGRMESAPSLPASPFIPRRSVTCRLVLKVTH